MTSDEQENRFQVSGSRLSGDSGASERNSGHAQRTTDNGQLTTDNCAHSDMPKAFFSP
jgi:hypothetical protein